MKFENTQTWGFEHAIRGMRNPKNSWAMSDSQWTFSAPENPSEKCWMDGCRSFVIGPKDLKLM